MGEQSGKLAKQEKDINLDKVENALLKGDLSELDAQERKDYYRSVCESVGLNPLTKPFEYIRMNGELTLYAKRDATEQLRKINGVSIDRLEKETSDSMIVCTAYATDEDGRKDVATGAVSIKGKKGDALANAIMKAETKAKRRVTLSICGLGWIDETEVDSIPDTEPAKVDHDTGEIIEEGDEQEEKKQPEKDDTNDKEDDGDTPQDYVKALLKDADDMDVDAMMDYAENTVQDYEDETEGWRQVYKYLKGVINGDEELEITESDKLDIIPF